MLFTQPPPPRSNTGRIHVVYVYTYVSHGGQGVQQSVRCWGRSTAEDAPWLSSWDVSREQATVAMAAATASDATRSASLVSTWGREGGKQRGGGERACEARRGEATGEGASEGSGPWSSHLEGARGGAFTAPHRTTSTSRSSRFVPEPGPCFGPGGGGYGGGRGRGGQGRGVGEHRGRRGGRGRGGAAAIDRRLGAATATATTAAATTGTTTATQTRGTSGGGRMLRRKSPMMTVSRAPRACVVGVRYLRAGEVKGEGPS